jgi:hypothetical protein
MGMEFCFKALILFFFCKCLIDCLTLGLIIFSNCWINNLLLEQIVDFVFRIYMFMCLHLEDILHDHSNLVMLIDSFCAFRDSKF